MDESEIMRRAREAAAKAGDHHGYDYAVHAAAQALRDLPASDVPPEVVERLVANNAEAVRYWRNISEPAAWLTEARAIDALLKPVDPDEEAAKRILYEAPPNFINSDLILQGIKYGKKIAGGQP